jgi:hypothetical protein
VIGVVHLVRHANGAEPFRRFLVSYREHDAGREHELVLLLKGFPSAAELEPYRELALGMAAREVHVSDDGLDLTAYTAAARELEHERLCFLNSFSTIAAPGWLALLCEALDRPDAGVVGATGSWGSHRSFALHLLRLPNGYGGALGDRRAMGEALGSVAPSRPAGRLRGLLRVATDLPREIAGHEGFPAPHVRTNAFAIRRDLLLSLAGSRLRSKAAAYRFEAGRRGLTASVRARGLEALVVGRDGVALPPDRWSEGDIFWQREQRDLLVADNQTRAYENGTPAVRAALARYAWGGHAPPAAA